MRREGLLRHLRRNGCVLRREGKEHTLWENPQTGHAETVPRHSEIANLLARRIAANYPSLTRQGKSAPLSLTRLSHLGALATGKLFVFSGGLA
jgi:hypothetical protein